jgi:hypothetical protein
MSLKAKLEAVIYAAEEPVTLAQLAALFAADAFEWKAQQEAASAEQNRRSRPTPMNDEFAYLGMEPDQTESASTEPVFAPLPSKPLTLNRKPETLSRMPKLLLKPILRPIQPEADDPALPQRKARLPQTP